jgi:hypothetical protein
MKKLGRIRYTGPPLTVAGNNDMNFNVFSKKEIVIPNREAKNKAL